MICKLLQTKKLLTKKKQSSCIQTENNKYCYYTFFITYKSIWPILDQILKCDILKNDVYEEFCCWLKNGDARGPCHVIWPLAPPVCTVGETAEQQGDVVLLLSVCYSEDNL